MKRILRNIMAAAIPVAMVSACEGNAGEDNGGSIFNEEYATGVYTLVADKTTIEANGSDAATFKLYSPEGEDLTATAQRNYITIENKTTGESLDGLTFTGTLDGDYTFYAYFKNSKSDNEVTIKVQNRAKYEKYYKKVAVYDLTSAYCGPCATLATALEAMDEEWADRMVLFAIHGTFQGQHDLWSQSTNNVLAALMGEFGTGAYPCLVFNLDPDATQIGTTSAPLPGVVAELQNQVSKYPAYSGIKIDTEYSAETNTYTVNAELTASSAGEFDLGCALLLDGQLMGGGMADHYNDIVRNISGNYMRMSDNKKTLAADEKMNYTAEGTLPDDASYADDYRVAVFSLRNDGGRVIIDNVAVCPLGEDVDYRLNE